MVIKEAIFKELVYEAWQHEFSGWDFVYISRRMLESPLSWNYHRLVLDKIKTADSLLDLDTGGGEFLSSLLPLPAITCATEGYPPNVTIAKARLAPLGVQICDSHSDGPLPFADNSFDLIINRHGDINASEIYRVLKPGKRFITQQVGGKNNIRLNEILQDLVDFRDTDWVLDVAVKQLEDSGFIIIDQREEYQPVEFMDIGAVVYYLKAIPWQINDFSVEKYFDRLVRIQNIIEKNGKLVCTSHRFYIEAQKKKRGVPCHL